MAKRAAAVVERESKIAQLKRDTIKKYGKESLVTTELEPVEVIPTGSFLLDKALGVGGFACGRLVELYGMPSSGKSTLALTVARNVQRMGFTVVYLDFENTFDPVYATSLGVDCSLDSDLWVLSQSLTLEKGMAIAEDFIASGQVGLVIVDSVASMVTEKEFEQEMTDQPGIAIRARQLSFTLRKIVPKLNASKALMLMLNHVNEQIGGRPSPYPVKVTPGGRALKFYSSARIELQAGQPEKGKVTDWVTGRLVDSTVSQEVKATIVKNKTGPMGIRYGLFHLRQGRGICEEDTVFKVAVARNIVEQKASRYIFKPFIAESGNYVNMNGREQAIQWLLTHPDQFQELKRLVLEDMEGTIAPIEEILEDEQPLDIEELLRQEEAVDREELTEMGLELPDAE